MSPPNEMNHVLASAPIGVAVMDYDGIYISVNPAYAVIYGYEASEMVGQAVTMVFPQEMHQRILELHRNFLDNGGALGGEWEVVRRDGQRLHVISHSVKADSNTGEKIRYVYVTNITQRRIMEVELRRSEELLALAMRGTEDAYFDVDTVKGIRTYSKRWWEMLGYEVDAWALDGSHWERLAHPDDLERVKTEMARIQSGTENRFEITLRMRHANGEYRNILVRAFVTRDAKGQVLRMTGANTDLTDRIRMEKEAHHFESIVKFSEDAVISKSTDGIVLSWNAGATRIFGYSAEEMIGHSISVLFPADRKDEEDLILERIREGEAIQHFETIRIRKDGQSIDISATISPIRDGAGKVIGASKIARDISFKKIMESRLRLASTVFATTNEGIAVVDSGGTIVEVNPAFESVTGYLRSDVIGQSVVRMFNGEEVQIFESAVGPTLDATGQYQAEHWTHRKDGEKIAVLLTISKVPVTSGVAHQFVVTFADVTSLRLRQEQLEYLAQHDALTDLPNRILFGDRLRQAMNVSRRQAASIAVAYIDLDGFKGVNDRLGHNAGDELLRVVSGRMKECIREADTLARIGGDEFVVLLLGVATPQDCEPLLDRLLAACREPVLVSGSVCNVTASIGIALQDEKELNPDALLRRADEAMYRAKEMGKNQYQFASP